MAPALRDLTSVINGFESLEGLLVGLEAVQLTLAEVDDTDDPEVQAAKQWAPLWVALRGVVEAVQAHREGVR